MLETRDPRGAAEWAHRMRASGLSVGFVPTMGCLHEGHFSLIERARTECDRVAVSVFVNPTQFGEGEDFDSYPRTQEADAKECRQRGVDLILFGEGSGGAAIYPSGFDTWVEVGQLSEPLCGKVRPTHFRGVATVVAVLFGIFRPHRAYFGQKDFQQARIIERLAGDLRLGVEVRILPTVRDRDGLAISSRNRYLSRKERQRAVAIPRSLVDVEGSYQAGEERPEVLADMLRRRLSAEVGLRLQYVEGVDASTLQPPTAGTVSELPEGLVLAVAAFSGRTRLIDNLWLQPPRKPS